MNTPDLAHGSLAEIPEHELVDRIVNDVLWGREFFKFHGMPSGMVSKQCVSLTSAPGNPKGDIDVLFCAPDLPHQSVAYQAKRVKLGIDQLRNGTPNKWKEFEKLAQQTNMISRMGFWQVYADIIVVADAREQNADAQRAEKLTFQGLPSELRSLLFSAVSSAIPSHRRWTPNRFTVGNHGLHVRRFCEPAPQSEAPTCIAAISPSPDWREYGSPTT